MAESDRTRQDARVRTKVTFAQARDVAKNRYDRAGRKGGGFFVHVIGFLCCFAMPAFWTAIAPISTTTLTRENGKVRAVARQNAFFVIPYRTSMVEDVKEVDDRLRQGEIVRRRSGGERHAYRSESESFLVLRGAGKLVEVPVSPVNAKSTLRTAEDFLRDSSQTKIRLITVANWKFSVIGGAFLTLLAILYTTGVFLSVCRLLGRWTKSRGVVEMNPALLSNQAQEIGR
jgi:hypothetical protein